MYVIYHYHSFLLPVHLSVIYVYILYSYNYSLAMYIIHSNEQDIDIVCYIHSYMTTDGPPRPFAVS